MKKYWPYFTIAANTSKHLFVYIGFMNCLMMADKFIKVLAMLQMATCASVYT